MSETTTKAFKGKGMDGFIARMYDKNARNHIMEQYQAWARTLKGLIPKGATVLEIAPGPGYLAIELARAGTTNITGLDISQTFVEIARQNAREADVQVEFLQGNASAIPFSDNSFTHSICTSAFKNFADPLGALKEIHRILVPGGVLWLNDMRGDATDADIDAYVRDVMRLRGINGLFTRMTFKQMLRKRACTKESFLALVSQTPLMVVNVELGAIEYTATLRKMSRGETNRID